MSEDKTQKLTDANSFEERVLDALAALNTRMGSFENELSGVKNHLASFENELTARMASFENQLSTVKDHLMSLELRLTSLEEKVDARLRETRPIWEGVNARLTAIEDLLDNLNIKFGVFAEDMAKMRGEHERMRRRVVALEDEQRAS